MSAIYPREPFDPEEACRGLHEAMRGAGTDEDAVIEILTSHNNEQRQEIAQLYETMYGESLDDAMKSELSGDLEDTLRGCILKPRLYDAKELRQAMKGAGTDETVLIEILCARPPDEIEAIKECYNAEYDRDLVEDVKSETSRKFERLLVSQLTGGRDCSDSVDFDKAQEDARNLFEAGEASWGTDESEFMLVLSLRNYAQLRCMFSCYKELADRDIEDSIKSELSGELEDGLLCIVKYAKDPTDFYVERLYKSMKGAGTDEETLKRVIISRSEIDAALIRVRFYETYDQTLKSFLEDDVSGDFKRVLLRLIGTDDE